MVGYTKVLLTDGRACYVAGDEFFLIGSIVEGLSRAPASFRDCATGLRDGSIKRLSGVVADILN